MYSIVHTLSQIDRSFYQRYTPDVAQQMLGTYIARYVAGAWCVGRIVETEAYTDDDPACHAYRGKTKANASLFGPTGHAYVYISYGIHACVNIVAYDAETQVAGGVLIRAIEPIERYRLMCHHRAINPDTYIARVSNGPGKVAQALGIDRSWDGYNVCTGNDLMLLKYTEEKPSIASSARVGISRGREVCWRFYVPSNHFVSPFR